MARGLWGRSFLEQRWRSLVPAHCLVSFQILVYKDDFTSERADRERAQSKIQELEETVASLRRQVSRRQVGREGSVPPEHAYCFFRFHELQAILCWLDPNVPVPGRATWGPVAENKAPHGLVCVEVVGMGHVTAEVAVLRACHVPDSTSWAPGSLLEASFIHVSSVLCPWRDPGCPVARMRMLRPRAPVSAETLGACFLHQ